MHPWNSALREAAVSGTLAGLLSAAALATAGRREVSDPSAPANATSHWLWGEEALHRDGADARHTLAGVLIHQLASNFWATLHARAVAGRPAATQPVPALAAAAVTATAAAFVDLRVVPYRLSPGFQRRLSSAALVGVYGSFAVGLALASVAVNRRRLVRHSDGRP